MALSTVVHIHTHVSGEQGIFANAYLVGTAHGIVVIDATLTRSESRALRARMESLGKPVLAVLLTHAHPDHVAGLTELVYKATTPIVALASVERLMRATEAAKRAQWGPVYQDEWIGQWTYPTQLVYDRDWVTFDDVTYRVYELGPGGDCDANSLWILETGPKAAFIGDLVFNGTHAYTADNHLLADVSTLYPGHGQSGGLDLLDAQRDYLLAYCAAVKELAAGQPALSEEAKGQLVARMERVRPGAGLTFLIGLGADAVAAELVGGSH